MPKIILVFYAWILFCLYRGFSKDTIYFLYLYISLYFLNPYFRWWGAYIPDLRYSLLSGILFIFFGFLQQGRYRLINPFAIMPFRWYFFTFLVIVVIWPYALVPAEHQIIVIQIFKFVLIYYFILKIVDTIEKFDVLIYVFLLGQFYLGWIAWETGRNSGSRLEGIGAAGASDANFAAAGIIVSIPILFDFILRKKMLMKIPFLIIAAFITNGLVLINSRASFLGIIVSMGYYVIRLIISPTYKLSKKIVIIIISCIGLLGSFYLTDEVFLNRLSTLSDPSIEGSGGRMLVWQKAFDVVHDYPFGVGRRGFEFLSSSYLRAEQLDPTTGSRAIHNSFLQALTDFGYLGFIVFMIFVISNFIYAERHLKTLKLLKMREHFSHLLALESAFLGYLVAIIFISAMYTEMLYLSSALIASYGSLCHKCFTKQDG